MMEWNNEKTLFLIEKFRNKEILWDVHNSQYYNKILKNDAWEQLAAEMGCSADECKKKITSLLASLRREKGKYTKSLGTGKGADEIYKSSWFAYKSLECMLDRNNPRPTVDSMVNEDANNSIPLQEESSFEELNESGRSPQVENFARPNTRKRKRNEAVNETEMLQSAFQILQSSATRANDDEFISFGNFIANKLKKYSERTKNYVQHMISNIIFSADQGEFDYNPAHPMYLYPPPLSTSGRMTIPTPTPSPNSIYSGRDFLPLNHKMASRSDKEIRYRAIRDAARAEDSEHSYHALTSVTVQKPRVVGKRGGRQSSGGKAHGQRRMEGYRADQSSITQNTLAKELTSKLLPGLKSGQSAADRLEAINTLKAVTLLVTTRSIGFGLTTTFLTIFDFNNVPIRGDIYQFYRVSLAMIEVKIQTVQRANTAICENSDDYYSQSELLCKNTFFR